MLARATGLRADAGLPPLIGDALLAKAARNHANYDKQWDEGHGAVAPFRSCAADQLVRLRTKLRNLGGRARS